MDRIGNQFLAGSILALDEDIGLAGRHAFNQIEQLLHLLALADDVLKLVPVLQLRFELLVFVHQ